MRFRPEYEILRLGSWNERIIKSRCRPRPLVTACSGPCCCRDGCRCILFLFSSNHLPLELAGGSHLSLNSVFRLGDDAPHFGHFPCPEHNRRRYFCPRSSLRNSAIALFWAHLRRTRPRHTSTGPNSCVLLRGCRRLSHRQPLSRR